MSNPFDFQAEVDRVLISMQLLSQLEIDLIISTISRADSLGPFLEPTLYMKQLNSGSMHLVEHLCRDLQIPVNFYKEQILSRQEEANNKIIKGLTNVVT